MAITLKTITGKIVIPGTTIGIRAKVTATPMTNAQALTFPDDDTLSWGPVEAVTDPNGILPATFKIPTNSAQQAELLWKFTAEPIDKHGGVPKSWLMGYYEITGFGTVDLADLVSVDITAVPTSVYIDIQTLVATASAAASSASASATTAAAGATSAAASASVAHTLVTTDLGTTDGQSFALVTDPNSQTGGALASTYVAIAARPINAMAAPYGLAVANTPADNRIAMRAALEAARVAGGGPVEVPRPGTFMFDKHDHPVYGSNYACMFAVPPGVTLKGAGVGATTFKLKNGETYGPASRALIYNRVLDGGDYGITLEDFTLDGNAANQTVLGHGIILIRTLGARHHRVRVKSIYGESEGLPTETFAFDAQLGRDTTYQDCEVAGDGTSSNTATGFASNGGTNVKYVNCNAHDLGQGHGWALYQVAGASHSNCWSYSNAAHGFNVEESADVHFAGCVAGGQMADTTNPTDPYPAAASTPLGNGMAGFVINNTARTHLHGVTSRYNAATGLTATTTSSGRIHGGTFSDNGDHGLSMADPSKWVVEGFPMVTDNIGYALSLPTLAIPSSAGYWGTDTGNGYLPPPTMPASDVTYRNPYPFPVVVYLSGGTYTAVDVGVGIGTPTQFHLAPNGEVTITYTAAPTWRWFATA